MWDYQPIMATNNQGEEVETPLAVWQEQRFSYVPTMEEIQNTIINYYNEQTNKEIVCGFTWNNMKVWLTTENQFNYKAAYDLAFQTNGNILPLTFKFDNEKGVVYYTFNDLETLQDFYVNVMKHIKTSLEMGWQKKDEIIWNNYTL